MSITNSTKRRKKKSFIFRGKSSRSKARQLTQAILMLTIGINLIFFLNTLPSDFIVIRLSKDIWINLYKSILESLAYIGGIGVALIVISLLIISLVLIIGGIIRLFVFYTKKSKSSNIR